MSHLVMCEESIFLSLVVVVNLYLTRVIPSEYLKVYIYVINRSPMNLKNTVALVPSRVE